MNRKLRFTPDQTDAGTPRRKSARARSTLAATLLAAALFAASLTAIAAVPAGASAPAHAAGAQKLQLRHTSLGSILVDASGFTLYHFSKDTSAKNTCMSNRECGATWPALTSSGRPTAGPGVKASLISTIALPGGKRQVTYAGHPLYTYEPAGERGETGYIGVRQFGGTWYGLSASGGNVK
jgi:predicted lipoprotein with Yx(FWY)xxD motif